MIADGVRNASLYDRRIVCRGTGEISRLVRGVKMPSFSGSTHGRPNAFESSAFSTAAASGFIADRIGRRTLLRNCAIGIAIYAVISPVLLSLGLSGEALYVFIGFALLGLSFGQSSGVVASGFSAKNRYTASNLTSDLAWMFGAGFAPFVALYLTESLGLWSAGAYLLSGALCTLAALTLFRRTQEEEASDAPSRR